MSDPFWTYQRVSWALKNYYDLLAHARPPRDPAMPPPPPPRFRASMEPYDYELVRILTDIDRALSILAAQHPDSYRLLAAVYLDPDRHWQRLSLNARVMLVSTQRGCTTRTTWRDIARAKERLVAILSGEHFTEQ